MKIKLLGKNLDDIRPLLAEFNLEESDSDFELVVAHGGDGTLLRAECECPGIPKLPLRDFRTAPQCDVHQYRALLGAFSRGKLRMTGLPKLGARCRDREFRAINDIFIHNFDRVSALRYRVWIDDALYAGEVVGDGVGVSSVHGSTAYYKSITHSIFRVGIGLSFSNSTEEVNHLVLPANSRVRVRIVRGPGLLTADNSPERIEVSEGDEAELFQSSEIAHVYGLQEFMCPQCRRLRHPDKSACTAYVPISGKPDSL